MFTVYHSNNLELLKNIASIIIENNPLCDPLQPEIFLVQNSDTVQWIQIQLANKFNISANIEFFSINNFIWEIITSSIPELPKKNCFSKTEITWRLMALLPYLQKQTDFIFIDKYLKLNGDNRKYFQLISQMAELFEQYLIFRPDWLIRWQKGEIIENIGEIQYWQALLWRSFINEMIRIGKIPFDCTNIYQYFINKMQNNTNKITNLPKRIFIYGISLLPPIFLQTLYVLSNYIDIYLLFMNPCYHYWGDISDFLPSIQLLNHDVLCHQQYKLRSLSYLNTYINKSFDYNEYQLTNHPLLASWGKQGQDTLKLLADLEEISDIDVFIESTNKSLLNLIQNDILKLENHSIINITNDELKYNITKKRLLQLDDDSITINSCHSQQREIEILYEKLLLIMTQDSTLNLRDIIVMAPDIDNYVSSIHAIFGNKNNKYYLSYTISDSKTYQSHPVISVFLSLFELPYSRFTVEQILELLEIPILAARFSIKEQDLSILRQWIIESGICWGLDDYNAHTLILPAMKQYTWQFGLTRMLLGYAMDGKKYDTWQGILPYEKSHGLMANLISDLIELLTKLIYWSNSIKKLRVPEEWRNFIHEIIEAFFIPDHEAEKIFMSIKIHWQHIIDDIKQAGYTQPISVILLKDELESKLKQERINQCFLTGNINFCTLIPMRAIPFRIVCLLGMNEGEYPRSYSLMGFDLIARYPRFGDRNRRNEDRYLFLEILLSTQQKLYISYIRCSFQKNISHYPSVLVNDLSNYISHSFYLPGDDIIDNNISADHVRTHLYHEHDHISLIEKNFFVNNNFNITNSYIKNNINNNYNLSFIGNLSKFKCNQLSFNKFLHFYKHPIRSWFQERLLIYFNHNPLKLVINEPFVINKKIRYQFNTQLLNLLIKGKNTEEFYIQTRASGKLPYGAFGELYWAKQYEDISVLAKKIHKYYTSNIYNQKIFLQLHKITINGYLTNIQPNGLLRWLPKILSMQDVFQLWLEHLIYCASGGNGESRILGIKGYWHFKSMSISQAKYFLADLVTSYLYGMTSPLLLLYNSGGIWMKNCYDNRKQSINYEDNCQQRAKNKLIQAWNGNEFIAGDRKDFYLKRIIPRLEEKYINEIIKLAKKHLLPLFIFNQSSNEFY